MTKQDVSQAMYTLGADDKLMEVDQYLSIDIENDTLKVLIFVQSY